MYYFGTNLDTRFSVPDFWPAPETTHKIPFEKDELQAMSERLKADRLEKRRRRLDRQEKIGVGVEGGEQDGQTEQTRQTEVSDPNFGVGAIDKWAKGR